MTQIFSVLFADDTNNVCSNENVVVLQDTLNRELAKLFLCFSISKLSLKLGKANYMFLGIIIDERLNIQTVKSKLSSILSIMYKASTLITSTGMHTLHCSLFQPYISYGNDIWGNNYASNVYVSFKGKL